MFGAVPMPAGGLCVTTETQALTQVAPVKGEPLTLPNFGPSSTGSRTPNGTNANLTGIGLLMRNIIIILQEVLTES